MRLECFKDNVVIHLSANCEATPRPGAGVCSPAARVGQNSYRPAGRDGFRLLWSDFGTPYIEQFLSPKHLDCMAAVAEHSMPVRA